MDWDDQVALLCRNDGCPKIWESAEVSLAQNITCQREGVELLALAKFFDLTSKSRFRENPERLNCCPGRPAGLNEGDEHGQVEAKSVDQLFQTGNRPHDCPPLQDVFPESVAPFDGKVLTESVALQAKKKGGSPHKKSP